MEDVIQHGFTILQVHPCNGYGGCEPYFESGSDVGSASNSWVGYLNPAGNDVLTTTGCGTENVTQSYLPPCESESHSSSCHRCNDTTFSGPLIEGPNWSQDTIDPSVWHLEIDPLSFFTDWNCTGGGGLLQVIQCGADLKFSTESTDPVVFPLEWPNCPGGLPCQLSYLSQLVLRAGEGPTILYTLQSSCSGAVPNDCYGTTASSYIDESLRFTRVAFDLIDPRAAILESDDYATRLSEWAATEEFIKGVAADGAARLLVRIPAYDLTGAVATIDTRGGGPAADYGLLEAPDGSQSGASLSLQPTQTYTGDFFFFYYRAPEHFLRAGFESTDQSTSERFVGLGVDIQTATGGTCHLDDSVKVVRPPVLLLHGVWSNATAFSDAFVEELREGGKRIVARGDYSGSNHVGFVQNLTYPKDVPEDQIRLPLDAARAAGIVAMKADVVAHSMGGLLTRLHVNTSTRYRRPDNFNEGDVYRIVTLDSPHCGTPIADVLAYLRDRCAQYGLSCWSNSTPQDTPQLTWCRLLKFIECVVTKHTDGFSAGAVDDLRSHSAIVTSLSDTEVPSHAIVGDMTVAGASMGLNEQMLGGMVPLLWSGVFDTPCPFSTASLFCNQGHDGLVNVLSQRDGMPSGAVSTQPVSHTSATESEFAPLVRILLGTRKDYSTWAYLPANSIVNTCLPPSPPASTASDAIASTSAGGPGTTGYNISSVEISLLSPSVGSPLTPGQLVPVSLSVTGDVTNPAVVVIGDGLFQRIETPPYSFTWSIPADAIDQVRFVAFVEGVSGPEAVLGPIEFPITLTQSPTSLEVLPGFLSLDGPGDSASLLVLAKYPDSVERDLTLGSRGTTYSSLDPGIVSVDQDGRIAAASVGTTVIEVGSGSLHDSCVVTVLTNNTVVWPPVCSCPHQGDINGDAVIDVFDVIGVIGVAFTGDPDPQDSGCPRSRGDVDNNGVTDVFDVIYLIATAFSGGAAPINPCTP